MTDESPLLYEPEGAIATLTLTGPSASTPSRQRWPRVSPTR
jgi:hypothetical protein